jgi:hypothetical protein
LPEAKVMKGVLGRGGEPEKGKAVIQLEEIMEQEDDGVDQDNGLADREVPEPAGPVDSR